MALRSLVNSSTASRIGVVGDAGVELLERRLQLRDQHHVGGRFPPRVALVVPNFSSKQLAAE